MPGKRPKKISRKKFAHEMVRCGNATEAAVLAGAVRNKREGARTAGSRLLKEPEVRAEIAKVVEQQVEKIDISVERVLREIHRIAMADPRQVLNADGTVKPVPEWDAASAAYLAGFEVSEIWGGAGDNKHQIGVLKKVKFWNKPQMLEALGKHLALFVERHEVTGKDGGPIATQDVQTLVIGDKEIKF